jgi:hypothetical protein
MAAKLCFLGLLGKSLGVTTLLRSEEASRHTATVEEQYGRSVAFGGVFGFARDPQRPQKYSDKRDTDAHYKPWAESIEKLGMQGVLLHDPSVFSPNFVQKVSTAHVHFHQVNLTAGGLYSDPARKELTPSDWRFVAMHDYLEQHPGQHDYVLLTDVTDVSFRRDPLRYMKTIDDANGYHFVFGQEEWHPWAPLDETKEAKGENTAFGRLFGYWKSCFGEDMPPDTKMGRMTNCGILGGHVSVVKPFLDKMLKHYATVPEEKRHIMCDMLVYLKTVTEDYNDRFISGYPFHAKFKHSDPYENSIIYHKSQIPADSISHRLTIQDPSLLIELPSNFTNTLAHANS